VARFGGRIRLDTPAAIPDQAQGKGDGAHGHPLGGWHPGDQPGVGPLGLHQDAAHGIEDAVQQEKVAFQQASGETATGPQRRGEHQQVPQRFVQESGMESLVGFEARQPVGGVNVDAPR